MGKSKSIYKSELPIAPWVYINDPTSDSCHATKLAALIPSTTHLRLAHIGDLLPEHCSLLAVDRYRTTVPILSDKKPYHEPNPDLTTMNNLRSAAIKRGCNFASVNIYRPHQANKSNEKWGTNHLNICASDSVDVAEEIYKWLFSVFTVQETLHLIPEEQMKEVDKKFFPEYEYCPINESRKRSKDAKIQFVALVLSKPEISSGQKLTWTVADRTGVANFYFQYRGPQSQYTWDWVLGLKPGDRRALPRMPMLQIKEKKRITVVKAPFRATAAVIMGTGFVIKEIGEGLCKIGKEVKLGVSSEWVPEADVKAYGKKIQEKTNGAVKVMPESEKTEIRIFNEKGEKTWSDRDSLASTEAGSVCDQMTEKDFS